MEYSDTLMPQSSCPDGGILVEGKCVLQTSLICPYGGLPDPTNPKTCVLRLQPTYYYDTNSSCPSGELTYNSTDETYFCIYRFTPKPNGFLSSFNIFEGTNESAASPVTIGLSSIFSCGLLLGSLFIVRYYYKKNKQCKVIPSKAHVVFVNNPLKSIQVKQLETITTNTQNKGENHRYSIQESPIAMRPVRVVRYESRKTKPLTFFDNDAV